MAALTLPATFALAEPHYRRSEETWSEAGRPRATVVISSDARRTLTIVAVASPRIDCFVAPDAVNALDNEPAAINGDGVQLYLSCGDEAGAWLLVPQALQPAVHVQPISGWGQIDGRDRGGVRRPRVCARGALGAAVRVQHARGARRPRQRDGARAARAGGPVGAVGRRAENSSIFVETATIRGGFSASRSHRCLIRRLAQIAVVLYEPQDPVNIAATVRAMKNMGVSHLRLVRPCDVRSRAARGHRARHPGPHRRHRARTTTSTPPSPTACASSASRRGVARPSGEIIDPKAAAEERSATSSDGPVGIVFGREDSGLPNEVLDRVHAAVTIPTTDHASLNLAQAVLIALYELHLAAGDATRTLRGPRKEAPPPTTGALRALLRRARSTRSTRSSSSRRAIPSTSCARSARSPSAPQPDARELSLLRAIALEVVRFLERTGRIERTLPDDVSPRPPRHMTGRDTGGRRED